MSTLSTQELSQHIPRRKSLRWRLLSLLAAITLATLLFIGLGVFLFISQNEETTWQERQAEAARYAAETVATFITRIQDTLVVVSQLDKNVLIENPDTLYQMLDQNQAFLELIRLDENGQVFSAAHKDNPLLANLFTIPQSRWFTESKEGRLYLGNVQISSASQPYLIFSIPAPDGGVVAARLQMNVLWDVVSKLNFGETGQAYLVNRESEIVAHKNPEEVVLTKTSLSNRPEMINIFQAPDNRWAGTYTNFENIEVIGVSAPVEGTEWIVITEVTDAEAFSVSRTALLFLVLGMTLFGLLVIGVTGRFVGRLILQPIEQLRTGAVRIGQGDYNYQIDLKKEDEMGQVAQAFNEMVARIRQRDEEIAKRTLELQESEERFRRVVTSISDHIYMTEITKKGEFINRYLSRNLLEITGYPRRLLLENWGFWLATIVHPEDKEIVENHFARFAAGENNETEYRVIKESGETIWVRDSGTIKSDPEQQTLVAYGVISDITERKNAEAQLEQQRLFLQQVIDINPHFIFAKDNNGKFTLANLAFANAYNTTIDELIGKGDADFNPYKEQVDRYNRDDMNVIRTGQELYIPEEQVIDVKGNKVWRQTIKRPILDKSNTPYQVLGVATDITDRKRFEEQLAAARDQALEASRLKTQLLSNVSHDLRTPIGAIMGFSEMLQEGVFGPLTADQLKATSEILDSTRHLLNFINNLLDQARIDAGKVSINTLPFNPTDTIQNVVSMLNVAAQTKELILTTTSAPNVPELLQGDPHWINQILVNLVSNAIKFTQQGEVRIYSFYQSNQWGLQVSDTGLGIPPDAQKIIFEAFRQVDGTATRQYGGMGLGLSIVSQLVNLMDGKITLRSEVGQGSTFTVLLPLEPAQEAVA